MNEQRWLRKMTDTGKFNHLLSSFTSEVLIRS